MLRCKCFCDAYLLWQTLLIKTSVFSLKQNNQMMQES
ncbi:TPA: hypothetical protein JAJ32_002108 [Legionella pneumophila]|uniref:Uncharacterized protein n=2 Tax=Legionella pneumophila subsp. pneumophila TaxID=91891 RepID=Q5ZX21_LEGPH|nr:hypothetical protein lpg0912 [Legionella pneumophila subsp. pneumophila str. Philadelphia 1]PNL78724.1 hypothetical protein A6J41_012480 [Legionella pneumophila subsp. pneumophila]PPK28120.1 hypothetical protein C3929_04985 [Legionella pneumophila]PPK34247.1 hypothetical protein C3927_03855 [Legionella pneumophila]PYB45616.1 hypothetical protein DM453_11330 [Legionella pneumophila]